MRQGETEALDDARGVITAAEPESHGTGSAGTVAVVGAGGHPIAHLRMDDARTGSIGRSIENAREECR